VGVALQESEPEPGLSVRECLAMYAGFYRAPRDIDETIALVGLTEQAGTLGKTGPGHACGPEGGIPLRRLRHQVG
jgi:ABC-type multidrug transport system ATPase subunit